MIYGRYMGFALIGLFTIGCKARSANDSLKAVPKDEYNFVALNKAFISAPPLDKVPKAITATPTFWTCLEYNFDDFDKDRAEKKSVEFTLKQDGTVLLRVSALGKMVDTPALKIQKAANGKSEFAQLYVGSGSDKNVTEARVFRQVNDHLIMERSFSQTDSELKSSSPIVGDKLRVESYAECGTN